MSPTSTPDNTCAEMCGISGQTCIKKNMLTGVCRLFGGNSNNGACRVYNSRGILEQTCNCVGSNGDSCTCSIAETSCVCSEGQSAPGTANINQLVDRMCGPIDTCTTTQCAPIYHNEDMNGHKLTETYELLPNQQCHMARFQRGLFILCIVFKLFYIFLKLFCNIFKIILQYFFKTLFLNYTLLVFII
jgi:hypothetical protein